MAAATAVLAFGAVASGVALLQRLRGGGGGAALTQRDADETADAPACGAPTAAPAGATARRGWEERQLHPVEFDRAALAYPERITRKVEAALERRSDGVLLVLERATDAHNYTAVLRTCEALGVQNVWVIDPPAVDATLLAAGGGDGDVDGDGNGNGDDDDAKLPTRKARRKNKVWRRDAELRAEGAAFARRAQFFLSVRRFATTGECIDALREEGYTIWATDLDQRARVLARGSGLRVPSPARIALVMGTESSGTSQRMLEAADERVYLPTHGMADSLNLSVAAALVMTRVLDMIVPEARGDMTEARRAELRVRWYEELRRRDDQRAAFEAALALPPAPFDDLRRPNSHRIPHVSKRILARSSAVTGSEGVAASIAAAKEREQAKGKK